MDNLQQNTKVLTEDKIQAELNRRAARKDILTSILPYMGAVILVVFFIAATGGKFIQSENLILLLNQCFNMLILMTGAVFLYALGFLDMGVGAVMSMSALIITLMYRADIPLLICVLAGMLVSVAFMSITAVAAAKLQISPFIASLCVMNVCDGIVLMANKTGKQFFAYSKASWLNEPWIKIIVLIIMFIAGYILFNYTHIGKSMISMGGSMKVAKISGINTTKMIFIAYIICSVAIGVASLFAVVRGGIADTSIGSSVNLNVMIAVVLGGFPLFGGGKARYQGPLIGALMVTILTNGLSMMGYASALGYAIKGILFLVVVGITYDRSKGKLID